MAFPTDLDNFTEKTDNVDDVMAEDVNELQGAIEALEAKVGIGASTPTAGKILTGTGTGTSSWEDAAAGVASEINAADAKTTPIDADLVGLVDSADEDVLKKLSWANIKATMLSYLQGVTSTLLQSHDGWQNANETWTRKDDDEIYAEGDVTDKYQKGDKIKFSQETDGQKYMYIIGVSSYDSGNDRTTLTVTGGDDYDLDDEAITDNYYSKVENPQGFPHWFSWTPTITMSAGSRGSENDSFRFCVMGNVLKIAFQTAWTQQSSNANSLRFTHPFTISATARKQFGGSGAVGSSDFGLYSSLDSSLTYVYKYDSSSSYLSGSSCTINGGVDYEI
jgi:hypothetical protein